MKIFLVTVLLSLTILSQTRVAGQHLLIETEDGGDDERGAAKPPVGAGAFPESEPQTDSISNAPRNPGRPLKEDDFLRASLLSQNPPRDASDIENILIKNKMFQQLADGELKANKHLI